MINASQGYFGGQSVADWRSKRAQIEAARKELNEHWAIMTEYERIVVNREVEARKQQYERDVIGGVIGEWNAAVGNLSAKLKAVENAKKREVARWEPARLGAEMNVLNMFIDQAMQANGARGVLDPDTLERLQTVYREASTSGDAYKAKAAAEIFQGLAGRGQGLELESRTRLNGLAKQAARDLDGIKLTDELKRAHAEASQAVEQLNSAQSEIFNTARAIGEMFPNGTLRNGQLLKALERVEQSPDGTFTIKEQGEPK